jgi:hypothetical protein
VPQPPWLPSGQQSTHPAVQIPRATSQAVHLDGEIEDLINRLLDPQSAAGEFVGDQARTSLPTSAWREAASAYSSARIALLSLMAMSSWYDMR